MTNTHYPAVMKFRVSAAIEAGIRIRQINSSSGDSPHIPGAITEITEGPFGHYTTTEVSTLSWIISWLRFSIKQAVRLYPTTEAPMVALYCTIKGNIPCKLQGYGRLVLQQLKYGFYYIPPQLKNTADFAIGEYDAVYISFPLSYLAEFTEQHPRFKILYQNMQEQVQQGVALPVYHLGQDELGILNNIRLCRLTGPAQRMFMQARINDLLVSYFTAQHFAAQANCAEDDSGSLNTLRETETYIKQHLHLPLSIASLSRQFGMNINSFEKEFKRHYHMPPRIYIEQQRIKAATKLLQETDLSVTDIAYQVGFASANYFSTVFKKQQQCSPRAFRDWLGGKK